jgi:hypothetical protein
MGDQPALAIAADRARANSGSTVTGMSGSNESEPQEITPGQSIQNRRQPECIAVGANFQGSESGSTSGSGEGGL